MSAAQRRKGKDGERELARLLREQLGADVTRNLEQTRQGGADLLGLPDWAIEVKRAVRPRLGEWWLQTCQQAEATGQRPALFYRLDRQPWRVVVALRDVATGFENAPLTLRLETDVEVFAALAREFMPAADPTGTPHRHGGSEAAIKATQWLLDQRGG